MTDTKERLWPYSKRVALIVIPIIWAVAAVMLLVSSQYLGWPDAGSAKITVPIVALLGFFPLGLVLVDFAVSSRAVLDIKGVKIDFSQQERSSQSFGLPDNIGIPGAVVTDSSPMKIIDALEHATQSEVAVIDIKDGNAWWVTRLLALCAGAVRSGCPNAIVFVGMKEGSNGSFLGWAEPKSLLTAILKDREDYYSTYHHAESIAMQLVAFHGTDLLPNQLQLPGFGPTLILHQDVNRYAYDPEYVKLGQASFEQILMDQLAQKHENPPDRLTLGRLNHLFEHCLHRDVINLSDPGDKQILSMLRAKGDFVALMKQDRYVGLLKAEIGQRVVLEQLFSQANERRAAKD